MNDMTNVQAGPSEEGKGTRAGATTTRGQGHLLLARGTRHNQSSGDSPAPPSPHQPPPCQVPQHRIAQDSTNSTTDLPESPRGAGAAASGAPQWTPAGRSATRAPGAPIAARASLSWRWQRSARRRPETGPGGPRRCGSCSTIGSGSGREAARVGPRAQGLGGQVETTAPLTLLPGRTPNWAACTGRRRHPHPLPQADPRCPAFAPAPTQTGRPLTCRAAAAPQHPPPRPPSPCAPGC